MAEGDFSVFAKIQADTSNFEKGMKKAQTSANNLSNTFNNVSKVITKALSFAGLAVGTKAIVDFGKSCVESANQATKQFNILDNTVKATGADAWTSTKAMADMSKTLSDETNYSVTEIQKMQSVLLGFRDITGDTFKEASDAILDMSTVMSMDLTSAVQTVGKALDDPVKGLDSLRRQGFAFTDEQKAELAQLVKTGKKIEAQKIILDELATTYGGAAKAGQDSFARQRHAVENFREVLGNKLMPTMKMFAENSATTFNSLSKVIEKIDFNQMGAVIIATFDTIKNSINDFSKPFKSVFEEIKTVTTELNLKPFISIIETLFGALKKISEISFERSMNSIKSLKDIISGFGENVDLNKVSEVVNMIISGFVFLFEEASKIFDTLQDNIKTFVLNVWNDIKSLFESSNKALADSESDIQSWGEFFYYIFNNLFRTVQDVIQSISYLLKGDWEKAWEFAKLAVLRIVDEILASLDVMSTGFGQRLKNILGIAKTVAGVFGTTGKAIKTAIIGVEKLLEKSGEGRKEIQEQIKESETKIEELTGEPADKNLKDLTNYLSGSKGVLGKFVDGFKEATEKAKKELDGLSGEWKPGKANGAASTDDLKNDYELYSEWDSKLLQQRLDNLNEWDKEAHRINIKLINQERLKATEAAKTEEEEEKINEYYNKEIEKEDKRFEEAKKARAKETFNKIIGFMKNFASNAVNIMKKVASTIKNVISKIGSIFTKLFAFNPDEALDNLLKFEDAVLTFFVETLPKLPAFFESAVQSISVLIQTILEVIDFEQISNIIASIIKSIGTLIITIAKNINQNADKLTKGFTQLVQTVITGIADWINSGGWKELLNAILTIQKMIENVVAENLPALVDTIIAMLPDLIDTLIASIVSASQTLAKLIKPILKLIVKLIEAIIEVAFSDEVLDASMEVIEAFVEAIIDILIKDLPKMLPRLIAKVIKFILSSIPKATVAIVKGTVKAFSTTDWGQVIWDCFQGFIDAFKELFGIHSPSTVFEEFGKFMIEGLWNGIKEMGNWLNNNISSFFGSVVSDISSAISNIFSGISSSFSNIWDNLVSGASWAVEGIKNAFNGITGTFSSIWNSMTSGANNAVEGIKNTFGGIASSVSSAFGNIGSTVKSAINGVIDKVNTVINSVNAVVGWAGIKLSTIQKLAKGTNDARKGLTLVGEAGPELVYFNGGERVLNNRNTNKALSEMGSGKSITNNITFNNTKDTTAFAMMSQLRQYNRQLAINGVL